MNTTRVAVALLAAAVATAGGRASAETYQHARALGARCSTCHDSKRPHLANLNAAGRYFLQRRTLEGYRPAVASEGEGRARTSNAPRGSSAPSLPGQAIFTRSCAVCHGPGGSGTALAAALTGPRKHATTEAAALTVIRNGIAGTPMVSFAAALTDQEIRDVAKYVMTLKPRRVAR